MTDAIPPEAAAAIARAVAEYEPEATAAVIASPGQLLSVLLEAARRATESAAPYITAAERDLLTQAEDALHSTAMRLLAVSPQLKTPYTDMPEQSPWSMSIGPQARRAGDLALAIRKHLGLPFRYASRALGTPPLEAEDAIAEAVAAERERIRAQGMNPLSGRCAYEAFAAATRETLNLPAWHDVPPEARADWQMTADGLLIFATMEVPRG